MSDDLSSRPRVTVVMPVYNGAATIRRAIKSLLAQTLDRFELLVVDDHSVDETPRVLTELAAPKLKVLRLPRNVGRAAARNVGVREAASEYVAMADADDVSYPDRLAAEAAFLDAHPDVALCGAWAQFVEPSGRTWVWRRPTESREIRRTMLRSNAFIHSSVMFRRAAVLEAGGYDESLRWAEDYDLFLRLAATHETANLPQVLAAYHAHEGARYRWLEQWNQVRVRWRALRRYGYPLSQAVYLATPLVAGWLPARWKAGVIP